MFLLDNEGPLNDLYARGRPNLEGRVLFTNGTPGEADAAFVKRNDPVADGAAIAELVAAGHTVTRNPVQVELDGGALRLWAAPDDSDEGSGTELVAYETRPG